MAERFDVYDEHDRWIGTAERDEVHARGYWHHTFHCWLVRVGGDGRARIVFQRRSAGKDTNPGRFDITAAGHLAAGETPEDGAREVEEELGVKIAFDRLTPLGTAREELEGTAQGKRYVDREVSYVFGYAFDGELSRLRLQEDEVAGVYEADADALIALMEGAIPELTASGYVSRGGRLEAAETTVAAAMFVPRPASYYVGVFGRLRELAERAAL